MIHNLIPGGLVYDINGCLETHRESCVITWLRITSMWDSESGKAVWCVACYDARYGGALKREERVRVPWTNGVAWPGIRRLALWQRGLAHARYEGANVLVAAMCSGG
jgi:hypothetical protein